MAQEPVPIPEPHDPWILLARWYLPQTGASLWRKQALLDVGGWKPGQPACQEHELYLRLVDQRLATWENRAQFFAVAAQLMRRILVDYARERQAAKRPAGIRVSFDEGLGAVQPSGNIFLASSSETEPAMRITPSVSKTARASTIMGSRRRRRRPRAGGAGCSRARGGS